MYFCLFLIFSAVGVLLDTTSCKNVCGKGIEQISCDICIYSAKVRGKIQLSSCYPFLFPWSQMNGKNLLLLNQMYLLLETSRSIFPLFQPQESLSVIQKVKAEDCTSPFDDLLCIKYELNSMIISLYYFMTDCTKFMVNLTNLCLK